MTMQRKIFLARASAGLASLAAAGLQFKDAAPSGLKTRDQSFAIKEVKDDGKIEGYGSVFGVVDSYREIVVKGAFAASLTERRQNGRKLPMLWQHRSGEPIGFWPDFHEDETGLYLEGVILKDVVERAREAFALAKAGVVTGLSIGYMVREDSYDQKERIRYLKRLDLEEVSVVTFPANDEARVEVVKTALAHGTMPEPAIVEKALREAMGFSKSQAAAIVSGGYMKLFRREAGERETEEPGSSPLLSEAAKALSKLSIPRLGG